jgi:RecA-family ATPase
MKQPIESQELIDRFDNNVENDLIEQVLPRTGYLIIGGSTGDGKTNEMLHLWYAFASKYQADYHGINVRQCPPLYINLEDDDVKLGKRLKVIKPQYKLAFEPKILLMPSLYLDTQDGIDELREIVKNLRKDKYNVGVIILDSLKYTVSGDYCKPQVAKRYTDNLKNLSKELKVAFILTHHTRKLVYYQGKSEDLLSSDRLKGAKEIIDHAEGAFLYAIDNTVKCEKGTTKRIKKTTLVPVKTRHAECELEMTQLELTFSREKLCWNGQKYSIKGNEIEVVKESEEK